MRTPADRGLLDDPLVFAATAVTMAMFFVAALWWAFHPAISYWTAWCYWWLWAGPENVLRATWSTDVRLSLARLGSRAATASFGEYWVTTSRAAYLTVPIVFFVLWR